MNSEREQVHFTSGGRNPNFQPVCAYPRCAHLIPDAKHTAHGWCGHPNNRVPPSDGWPTGFTPSLCAVSGGCDLHTGSAS